MAQADASLIRRVASKLNEPPSYADEGVQGSILTVAATSYGSRPAGEEVTQPTGFDPEAAALFEAVVEGAYLVANADQHFDDVERTAFQHVVLSACSGRVLERQVTALLADLKDQLSEDGLEKRVRMVARTINKPEHGREVLRVAALIAQVSGGISQEERGLLGRLCEAFNLNDADLQQAIGEAERALESD